MDDLFTISNSQMEEVWINCAVGRAVYMAAQHSNTDELTMLRAVCIQLHRENKRLLDDVIDAAWEVQAYRLMTEGIKIGNKRYVFRPKDS